MGTRGRAGAPAPPLQSRRAARPLRRIAASILAALALAGAGCEEEKALLDGAHVAPPFPGSAPSLDRLGAEVTDGLVAGDVARLERVRLTEAEHNDVVWPELPASAPEVGFPLDYAWANIENRNRRAVARMLGLYEGQRLRFGRVECRGGIQAFETFAVLTDCWVVFARLGESGAYEAQIFKDVLVRGGGHKIFRYYDEAPRRYSGKVHASRPAARCR